MSGEWDRLVIATTDNFDFTGGTGGNGAALPGEGANNLRVVRPNIVGNLTGGNRNATPGADGSWLDPAAVARPAKGDPGNASRYSYQNPPIDNWNLAFFKNFGIGGNGKRRLQLRWEMYNVLNHIQFATIDNTARFDTAGNQVNAGFGEAIAARTFASRPTTSSTTASSTRSTSGRNGISPGRRSSPPCEVLTRRFAA